MNHSRKQQPAYTREASQYPNAEPIFLATDWPCLKFIRKRQGICLLCNYPAYTYDFSLCADKEIWILSFQEKDPAAPLNLAYELLAHHAKVVKIIPFNRGLL